MSDMRASTSPESEHDLLIQRIESLPNLRLLCTQSREHLERYGSQSAFNGAIYRSSKPDRISAEDVVHFKKLGIKTIVDFRSVDEYRGTDGMCFLDKEYSLYKVRLPKSTYERGSKVETELLAKCDAPRADESGTGAVNQVERKHFLINFFTSSYIVTSFKRVSWYMMFIGIFHALYDFVKKNKFETFINFFIQNSINKGGIIGQYKDIVDASGIAICSALKLVSDPDNLPVLINCAHGKDRTGIMSALILICLGKSEDYVQNEYSLSAKGLEPVKHIMRAEMIEKLKLKECFTTASPNTLKELLAYINDKYGSVQQYMVQIGFDHEDQQLLRDNLMAFENQECARLASTNMADGSNVDAQDVTFN